jgi:hypothetical protein
MTVRLRVKTTSFIWTLTVRTKDCVVGGAVRRPPSSASLFFFLAAPLLILGFTSFYRQERPFLSSRPPGGRRFKNKIWYEASDLAPIDQTHGSRDVVMANGLRTETMAAAKTLLFDSTHPFHCLHFCLSWILVALGSLYCAMVWSRCAASP